MDDNGNMHSSGPFCGLEKMFSAIAVGRGEIQTTETQTRDSKLPGHEETEHEETESFVNNKDELYTRDCLESDIKLITEDCCGEMLEINKDISRVPCEQNEGNEGAVKNKESKETICETFVKDDHEKSQKRTDFQSTKQKDHETVTRYY